MLPQNTDWFRNQIAALPHEWDSPTSTREKLERRAEFDRWLAEVKAQTIRDAIAYLKTTPAVTLTGKGGGYELLEAYRQGEEQ
jgi:hypothetical protein